MDRSGVFTVSGLTRAVAEALEGTFPYVWVRGQVTNVSRPGSGHLYFSLRDERSALSAVWFKGSHQACERFDPLTGEVYEDGPKTSLAETLENGQEVVCAGRLRVYGARGIYQLVVELAQEAGLGRLHGEFERLKSRLLALGYFDLERKRPIPHNPKKVAVITAPSGAAIQDFLRLSSERGCGASIRIHAASVQGEAAPAMLRAALRRICDEQWAEVVVFIRGGGSLEDLWAFNDESLARAIFESNVPVVAGIGHEVDFTLADMTADLRAATPSHAAQLLWPSRQELGRRLETLRQALERAERHYFAHQAGRVARLVADLSWRSPHSLLDNWSERLKLIREKLRPAALVPLERRKAGLGMLEAGLARAPGRLEPLSAALGHVEARLHFAGVQCYSRSAQSLERMELALEALNPHAPLKRGYALVQKGDGTYVRSGAQVAAGEKLQVKVNEGQFSVLVQK